jgi:hypothetical protein
VEHEAIYCPLTIHGYWDIVWFSDCLTPAHIHQLTRVRPHQPRITLARIAYRSRMLMPRARTKESMHPRLRVRPVEK